jgi:hypothetical protein
MKELERMIKKAGGSMVYQSHHKFWELNGERITLSHSKDCPRRLKRVRGIILRQAKALKLATKG